MVIYAVEWRLRNFSSIPIVFLIAKLLAGTQYGNSLFKVIVGLFKVCVAKTLWTHGCIAAEQARKIAVIHISKVEGYFLSTKFGIT